MTGRVVTSPKTDIAICAINKRLGHIRTHQVVLRLFRVARVQSFLLCFDSCFFFSLLSLVVAKERHGHARSIVAADRSRRRERRCGRLEPAGQSAEHEKNEKLHLHRHCHFATSRVR